MLLPQDTETIVALATPQGNGAIAMIRLSGETCFSVVGSFGVLSSGKKIIDVASHSIHFGAVVDKHNSTIDQVMFIVMHGPKTFTGQHVVEITCHNNPFIIQEILEQAILCGARLATEGEFSKRAVLNKKMDLIQAEAIKELIHANNRVIIKNALAQTAGSFSHSINILEKKLIKALALSEASFEFIDEEMQFDAQIKEIINETQEKIVSIKRQFNQQKSIREGVRIVLIGSVNAGKSSLFNVLIGLKRSIVTNIPGTTRDTIEAGIYKKNFYATFIDTAGLRETGDAIEKEGIERSYSEAHKSDLILLIIDESSNLTNKERHIYENIIKQHTQKIIAVRTKNDLSVSDQDNSEFYENITNIRISSLTGCNVPLLESMIEEKITMLYQAGDSPFLVNQRHYNLSLQLENHLRLIQELFKDKIAYELISYHLIEAISVLTEFTGKTISEAGMDAIFKEFCVGK